MWFNRFCGVDNNPLLRAGVGVGVTDEAKSFAGVAFEEALRARDAAVPREPPPRDFDPSLVFERVDADRVTRAFLLELAADVDGSGDVF